ncbi:helix-turn-helix transcriptional regulator [Candidatus Methylobacter oryzae]|uniref:WYL domain-containing protein n=1 Tax=Candidatus Methylobacter oryzae TaxID=2497749 RepID=A0ABY3CB10_9GAMM|nr:WYL domain-containing protein [Candidatus Methylobacter oryzae]TRW95828.1 WYL domain-containing protein [Candidatus Methylobacter oryzae]
MPGQKSQATLQRRLQVLESIRKLSGRSARWVTVSEIVNDLKKQGYEVSVPNIRRDLKSLLETHQQLECNDNSNQDGEPKNGLAHGYRWAGRDNPTGCGITLPEALSLVMVERYLNQSLPVLLTRSLHDIFNKAHQTLELHKKNQITQWPEKFCVIQPTQPLIPPTLNQEILGSVHEALLNEKQLRVTYQAPNRPEAKEYRLHPLGLIQRGPVTYLAAMANDYEDPYLYALHRMQAAQILEQDCRHKPAFNLTEFSAKQGHFGSAAAIHLKARICDHLALILEETRLSEDQIISPANESGFREITAAVSDTWQLRWWILGQCDRIEVLEPEALRLEIAESVSKCNQQYLSK